MEIVLIQCMRAQVGTLEAIKVKILIMGEEQNPLPRTRSPEDNRAGGDRRAHAAARRGRAGRKAGRQTRGHVWHMWHC